MKRKFKVFDHTPEYKEKVRAWREFHTKLSQPTLHDLGMRIKNGKHSDAQIAKETGISAATIKKIRNFEHGGTPLFSTILALQRFFRLVRK